MKHMSVPYLVLIGILVTVIKGIPFQNTDSTDKCQRPSFRREMRECCPILKNKIWGDLTPSFIACGKKVRTHLGSLVSQAPEDGNDTMVMIPPIFNLTETDMESRLNSSQFPPGKLSHHGRRLYERLEETIRSIYDLYKKGISILLKSLMMIADRHHRRGHKECFMECVFKEEGFLTDEKLDKENILTRFKSGENDSDEWHNVALKAAKTCLAKNNETPTNALCNSGASEMFECVFKEIFFDCPVWPENDEHCNSLRDYYQKCPDSPPPPMDDKPIFPPEDPENVTEKA